MSEPPDINPPDPDKGPDYAKIIVSWDPVAQRVGVQFKNNEFKTWDFVLAVLDMATKSVEANARAANLIAMQQAAMEQQRDAALAQRLRQGR